MTESPTAVHAPLNPAAEQDLTRFGFRRAGGTIAAAPLDRPPPAWYATAPLWRDTVALRGLLTSIATARRTRLHIAASYILQGHIKYLAVPAVAARLRWNVTLDVRPENVLFRISDNHSAGVALVGEPADIRPPGDPWTPLIEHIRAAVDAFGKAARLGVRTMWGDVATALTVPFTRLYEEYEDCGGDPLPVVAAARELLEHPALPLRGLGTLVTPGHPGCSTLRLARTTCCLIYKADSEYCDSCTILPLRDRLNDWAEAAARRKASRHPRPH